MMNDEAQLEVRYVPIGDVHPWEKNPKKHNKKAILGASSGSSRRSRSGAKRHSSHHRRARKA